MTERPSPIRVLRIIARMNVGGPAVQVVGLTEQLDRRGFESRLLVGEPADGEADLLMLRGSDIEPISIPGLGRAVRLFSDVVALRAIRRHIRDFRPHVLHTHTAKAGVLGRVAALGLGVPVIVHTFHGHLLHGYFPPAVTKLVVLVERLLALRSTVLASVGGRVRDDLLAAGIGRLDQYRVVAPGVPAPASVGSLQARRALGIGGDDPIVVFVGRLTGVKRLDRLLAVARLVLERRPHVQFVIVGGGDAQEEARRSSVDLGDRVAFFGWRGDVENVYGAADLILLTSDNEGMPVTLIEAQMCGVPAVATAVGSVGEVVADGVTGLVVEPTAESLARAVIELLDDDERRAEMGRQARRRALASFSVDRLIDDTEQMYRSALTSVEAGVR